MSTIVLEKIHVRSTWRALLHLLRKKISPTKVVSVRRAFKDEGDGNHTLTIPEYGLVGSINRAGELKLECLDPYWVNRVVGYALSYQAAGGKYTLQRPDKKKKK